MTLMILKECYWNNIKIKIMLGKIFNKSKEITSMNKSKKNWTKDDAEFIVLFGSQSGSTEIMANTFFKRLLNEGKLAFIDELDNYSTYKNAKHLIVFTSTYGAGDPPSSASEFEDVFNDTIPLNPLKFSVVAFGSTSFQDFCQFGVNVDSWLESSDYFERFIPLVKVDNQSEHDFQVWNSLWDSASNNDLKIDYEQNEHKSKRTNQFTIVSNQEIASDKTHLIKLTTNDKVKFQSGDLLSVFTDDEENPRQYSIARIGDNILLSIKKHDKGICSNYLCNLSEGNTINASVEYNKSFHFAKNAPSVWMIGNGTGVAPFLGMIEENTRAHLKLIWGGRYDSSFDLYKPFVDKAIDKGLMDGYDLALSRTGKKQYVQNILANKQLEVSNALESGSVFMICGSIKMESSVLKILDEITNNQLDKPLSYFQKNGQILKDCY